MGSSGWMLALAAVLVVLSGAAQSAPLPAPVVTEEGALQGVREGSLTVYRGAPYAAAPLGDLRWRPPEPARPWTGVRRADAFAPACMQTGVSMPGETPPRDSEDCLYLNIWTPAKRARERLPVMVWFPGGGFTNGSASMPLYWGDKLARKDVIVVTVGYRLGPFGFLAHPELTRESAHATSGDYGLLDQIAALQWVRRNIGCFGGDAGRVTIFGQSAGSMSVSLLMASPLAKGLFQRAIGESGGVFEPLALAPNYRLAGAEQDGIAYAGAHGAHSLAELRRLPAADLLRGDVNAVSHPIIDAYVLPAGPYDAFAAGRFNDVPVLIGSNAEEARSLIDHWPVRAASFVADLPGFVPAPMKTAAFLAAYPHATDAEADRSRVALETDLRFGWDMWAWARLQGRAAHSDVYVYRFDRKPPFPAGSAQYGWGAGHYAELWYAFDHLDQDAAWAWTPADRRLADQMSSYWTNFAKRGDPNGPGVPPWPRFRAPDGEVMHLDAPSSVGPFPVTPGLRAIDALYDQVRGPQR